MHRFLSAYAVVSYGQLIKLWILLRTRYSSGGYQKQTRMFLRTCGGADGSSLVGPRLTDCAYPRYALSAADSFLLWPKYLVGIIELSMSPKTGASFYPEHAACCMWRTPRSFSFANPRVIPRNQTSFSVFLTWPLVGNASSNTGNPQKWGMGNGDGDSPPAFDASHKWSLPNSFRLPLATITGDHS